MTDSKLKIAVIGPVGSGKSFVINEIIGKKAVKDEVSVGPVTRDYESVEGTMEIQGKVEEVIIIDTPGLEGEKKIAKELKRKLRETIESIDKAIIVIKNKRLEPTESSDIKFILNDLNYRDNPENFVFVLNDGRNASSEKQRQESLPDCLSILDVSKYQILKRNQQNNSLKTSKAIGLPYNKDQSFDCTMKTLKLNLNKEVTSISLGKKEVPHIAWNHVAVYVAYFAFASLVVGAYLRNSTEIHDIFPPIVGLITPEVLSYTSFGNIEDAPKGQSNQDTDDYTKLEVNDFVNQFVPTTAKSDKHEEKEADETQSEDEKELQNKKDENHKKENDDMANKEYETQNKVGSETEIKKDDEEHYDNGFFVRMWGKLLPTTEKSDEHEEKEDDETPSEEDDELTNIEDKNNEKEKDELSNKEYETQNNLMEPHGNIVEPVTTEKLLPITEKSDEHEEKEDDETHSEEDDELTNIDDKNNEKEKDELSNKEFETQNKMGSETHIKDDDEKQIKVEDEIEHKEKYEKQNKDKESEIKEKNEIESNMAKEIINKEKEKDNVKVKVVKEIDKKILIRSKL